MGLTKPEEQRLRTALTMIGEASDVEGAAPTPLAPTRARHRSVAVGAALAVATVAGVSVLFLRAFDSDTTAESGSSVGSQTSVEGVACARVIAEGTVKAVREAPEQGRIQVTFAVQDWIKPTQGDEEIVVEVRDFEPDIAAPWIVGHHLYIIVPENSDLEAGAYSGTAIPSIRDYIDYYLPKAQGQECPAPWRGTDGE